MNTSRLVTRLTPLAAALSLATTACTAGPTDLGESTDAVIGGVPAFSRSLDAVGSLNKKRANGEFTQSCTATLIAPSVVVTAEHCLENLGPGDLQFAIGADSRAPRRSIAARTLVAETSITDGGFVGFGSDVAVVHLAAPVTDVQPLRYAAFDERRIGQRFTLLGYGLQSTTEEPTDALFGTRMAATQTLRGPARGRILEQLFGSFDNFLRNADELSDLPTDEAGRREAFDAEVLLTDYEAVFGGAPGEAQDCFGDSGGPILKNVDGRLVVFGVTSGGFPNSRQVCGPGGVYAVFGPVVLQFLQRESGVGPLRR